MYDDERIDWLVQQSMLHTAKQRARQYAGQGRLWQHPYALARPRSVTAFASVWLAVYPASIITAPGDSVLQTLGNERLWTALSALGVQGMHTGPMRRAGGLHGTEFTPTVDGHFDRISLEIDPLFGSEEQLVHLSRVAAAHNAVTVDDSIPSHTGKGADFRLAEMAHGDYPGLYHMVEIAEADWALLPAVPAGRDAANLSPAVVDALKDKHYIVGQLQRVIFFEPGVKETDWSVTGEITGVDGKVRRWVYLHYFKEGQPSLNWLDPTFGAQQLVTGEALHAIDVFGSRVLRLDANGFLGVERRAVGNAWSESHPMSLTGNQLVAGMIRKAGGFSFQELNLTLDDIAAMSQGGADLSYDFITRPAYQHALLTGDVEFLRLMLQQMHAFGIDPASLIHALQNHDELTLELVHFWTLHANETYQFRGQSLPGSILREQIRAEMYEGLTGDHAPYNLKFVTNGVACTTVSIITAALGIRDLASIDDADIERIRRVHLLLLMFNAMQPGVVALSGWDLVGALPLEFQQVQELIAQGDTRWINRGAYDLVDLDPGAERSSQGLPRARRLYGSLEQQLQDPQSFASQARRMLAARHSHELAGARQIAIPDTRQPALLVMVHELPAGRGIQVTALNFGSQPLDEVIWLDGIEPGPVVDIIHERLLGELSADGALQVQLQGYEGLALRIIGHGPHVP